MLGIVLKAFLEVLEHETKKEKEEEVKKPITKEEDDFFKSIGCIDDFCFDNGILGNCTEKCPLYMKEKCKLLD